MRKGNGEGNGEEERGAGGGRARAGGKGKCRGGECLSGDCEEWRRDGERLMCWCI